MKQSAKDEIRKKYDQFASKYDRWESILELLFIGRLRRELLKNSEGRVLEIGIGTGKNLRHYSKECEIIGVDYTPVMLEIARERAKRLGRKASLSVMDAEHLRFRKGRFDTVVDTLGLCTYPNPIRALQEMKRACKRDGQILLLEHGESNNRFVSWLQQRLKKKQLERLGCHLDRDILGLVNKVGLRIIEQRRVFFGIFFFIRTRCS